MPIAGMSDGISENHEGENEMKISARNVLKGKVVKVTLELAKLPAVEVKGSQTIEVKEGENP